MKGQLFISSRWKLLPHQLVWYEILVGISLPHWCCTTVCSKINLPLFFRCSYCSYIYQCVSLYFQNSPYWFVVSGLQRSIHASPSSYLEHNSSKLEVSLSQKGSRKYKHPMTEERSLFFTFFFPCSHFVNTEKPKVGWMRNFPSFTLAGRKYTPCHWW